MADKTENANQDAKTSDKQEGTTSQETQTFTKKDVEEIVRQATSDALAEIGRTTKKALEENANFYKGKLSQVIESRFNDEMESSKDDPARLNEIKNRKTSLQRELEIEERERAVAAKEQETMATLDRTKATERQIKASQLATKYNISAEMLIKFGGDNMDDLAKSYGERSTEEKTKQTTVVYSGKTKGGSAGLTRADVVKMSPQERKERASEIAAIPFG